MACSPVSISAIFHLVLFLLGTATAYPSNVPAKREPTIAIHLTNSDLSDNTLSWTVVTVTFVTTDIYTSTTTYSTSASGSEDFFTTTYIATDLQTITTIITSTGSIAGSATCEFAKGETTCGNICCAAGQYCASLNECRDVGGGSPSCDNPCGYYAQLCCAANEICFTDSVGQAQCGEPGSGTTGCSNPCGFNGDLCCASTEICQLDTSIASCVATAPPAVPSVCSPLTTVYTTTSSYQSTVLETITLVLTRIETGIEIIIRTATFQPPAQLCLPELGQIQCGAACCGSGQFCQSPGICVNQFCPPLRPTSQTNTITTVPFVTPAATSS